MRFMIRRFSSNDELYHIALNSSRDFFNDSCYDHPRQDVNIAKYLDLSLKDYQSILISHGAHRPINFTFYYFNTEEEAQKAIEELEPHLVMKELIGG